MLVTAGDQLISLNSFLNFNLFFERLNCRAKNTRQLIPSGTATFFFWWLLLQFWKKLAILSQYCYGQAWREIIKLMQHWKETMTHFSFTSLVGSCWMPGVQISKKELISFEAASCGSHELLVLYKMVFTARDSVSVAFEALLLLVEIVSSFMDITWLLTNY